MATVNLNDLKNVHRLQVQSYTSIMTKRSREHATEIAGAFEDTRDTKLLEPMYSNEDAHKMMMKTVLSAVAGQVSTEYNLYAQRSALFMQQLFQAAEKKETGLKIDLKALDSAVLLDGLDKLFIDSKTPALGAGGKLTSMGHGGVDENLVLQLKGVEKEVAAAQAKFDGVQNQAKGEMKSNMDLKSEIKLLKAQAAAGETDAANANSGNEKAQQIQIEELKKAIAAEKVNSELSDLIKELEETKKELSGSIATSTQFKTLKTMIQDKNKQVKTLRDEVKSLE